MSSINRYLRIFALTWVYVLAGASAYATVGTEYPAPHERSDGKWDYVNADHCWVISPVFDAAHPYRNGRAIVKFGNNYGIIDKYGKYIVSPRFEEIYDKGDWKATGVKINGRWGFINENGNVIINPKFDMVRNFSEGLAPAALNGLYGYINQGGEVAINHQFSWAGDFSEQLAPVELGVGRDSKFGFIDKRGQFYINPEFDYAEEFKNGRARVVKDGKIFSIDKNGAILDEVILDLKDKNLVFGNSEYTEIGGKRYKIRKDGRVLLDPSCTKR